MSRDLKRFPIERRVRRRTLAWIAAGPLAGVGVRAEPAASRSQALQALFHPDPTQRLAAVERLAQIGRMIDTEALALRLRDEEEAVRDAAAAAMWAVWSRSGDAAIDRLFERGVGHLRNGDWEPALAVFGEIVRRKPDFAEGWNKRATVLYLLGRDTESLADCDEVLKRNRHHFGALSGMAQIHLRRGDVERALQAYRRALEVNPNLENAPQVLRQLEDAVRARRERGAARPASTRVS